jgi:hypothetical protein
MWDLTYGLMSMTPLQSGYYGFLTGAVTAGTLSSIVYYARRSAFVHPTGVLHKSMHLLNSSADVRIAMGGYLTSTNLSAFNSRYGSWTLSSWKPTWSPARVEMIFKIYCQDTEGIATVIATQNGLHSQIEFLGVDIMNKDSLRILVEGDRKDFVVHDLLRSKVVLN